eukprot:1160782-Pelagomonas_calceolata.AAC.7
MHVAGQEVLAPSLLCLDTAPVLGHNHGLQGAAGNAEGRLSALGSAILITVLRFSQVHATTHTHFHARSAFVIVHNPHSMSYNSCHSFQIPALGSASSLCCASKSTLLVRQHGACQKLHAHSFTLVDTYPVRGTFWVIA